MSVSFNVLGETIEFHEDLITYYSILNDFKKSCKSTTKKLQSYMGNVNHGDKEWDLINAEVDKFIKTLIKQLGDYGIFDATRDTFMKDNKGETAISEAHKAYLLEQISQQKQSIERMIIDERAAQSYANSQIRGLDFGVITGSVTGAIVYDMMNQKEIEKQTQLANSYYQTAVSNSIDLHQNEADLAVLKYYYEKFYPELIAAVSLLYDEIFTRYIDLLDNRGVFDLDCVASIDESKAIQIMENLDIQSETNKPKIFAVAIGTCPYSVEVYRIGFKKYLSKIKRTLKDACGDLIRYFGLEKELHDIWVSADTLFSEAKSSLTKEDYKKAEDLYTKIIELYPKDYRGYLGMLLVETWCFTKQTVDLDNAEYYYHNAKKLNADKEKNTILSEYYLQYAASVDYLQDNKDVDQSTVDIPIQIMEKRSRQIRNKYI